MSSLNAWVDVDSPSVAEPRTSANSNDSSTSAPLSSLRAPFSHMLHGRGVRLEGPPPIRLTMNPPMPANGTWHSMQRGDPGRTLYSLCSSLNWDSCFGLRPCLNFPVRYQYQISSYSLFRVTASPTVALSLPGSLRPREQPR